MHMPAPRKAAAKPARLEVKPGETAAVSSVETSVGDAPTIEISASNPAPKISSKPQKEPAMTMKDTLETVTKTSQNAAKEGMEKAMAAMSEMNAMTKANLEAMMTSATVATKSMEALTTRSMAYSKESMERSVAAMKSMSAAKSVQELVELQSEFVKKSMDAFMGEMNTTVEMVTASAKDSLKPLNERAAAFMSMMQTKA
jgi:phasin family protein